MLILLFNQSAGGEEPPEPPVEEVIYHTHRGFAIDDWPMVQAERIRQQNRRIEIFVAMITETMQ